MTRNNIFHLLSAAWLAFVPQAQAGSIMLIGVGGHQNSANAYVANPLHNRCYPELITTAPRSGMVIFTWRRRRASAAGAAHCGSDR